MSTAKVISTETHGGYHLVESKLVMIACLEEEWECPVGSMIFSIYSTSELR